MRVRFFTFVKNEIQLIDEWLKHHAAISRWYLLHVVDNGSTDGTVELLEYYKNKKGLNYYTYDDYTRKGDYLTSLILKYKNQPGISFPVDADEFVTLYQDNKIIKSPVIISNYLHKLPTHCGAYNTIGALFSVPEQPETDNPFKSISKWKWRWNNKKMCKKFYVNKTFKSTDHGNHNCITENNTFFQTDIALLHYHNTGKDTYKFRCEQDIEGLKLNIDVIKEQIAAPGEIKGTNNNFAGREKVNSYLNINNWKYEKTDDYDINFRWS